MDPKEDSLGLVLRDLVILGVKWCVVLGAVAFVSELPVVRKQPFMAHVPRISDYLPQRKPHHPKPHPSASPHRVAAATAAPTTAPTVAPTAAPTAEPTEAPKPVATAAPVVPTRTGKGGVRHAAKAINGIPVQVVTVDLNDPAVVATISLAKNAARPNIAGSTIGDEPFDAMVKRTRAAVTINGTFFSKDEEKRVMGNMNRDGTTIKFSQWEKGGTTFALGAAHAPRMMTDGVDLDPEVWNQSWLALTAGPRLLRHGVTWCKPTDEGFHDSHVLGSAGRSALGFDAAGKKLFLVSFDANVTLNKAAEVMRAIGCAEAMNLDGGASRSLAVGSQIVVPAGRPLTNVLAIYDKAHPAPKALRQGADAFRP